MARILSRPMFRKGGLSKAPRPSYRGGGVTAIRPGYRGGGMNGIMSGIIPRRGYAEGPKTLEDFREKRKIEGLPYLTLPKIEDIYKKRIDDQQSTVDMMMGIEEEGPGTWAEKQYDILDFLKTEEGKKDFQKPLIKKMEEQVAKRKKYDLPVSEESIVAETNGTKTNGTSTGDGTGLDTRSQFEKYFGEYLPVIQEQLAPDSDAAARDKWLALARFGTGVMAQPGGDLAGAIGKAAEKPLEDLSKISAQERQAKQVPKMIAIQAALNRMKGPTATEIGIDADRIKTVAKGFMEEGIKSDASYILANKLDKIRGDSELAGKFNKKLPEGDEGKKKLKKLKGKHFFYTEKGELKIFDGDKQEFLSFQEYKALPKDQK